MLKVMIADDNPIICKALVNRIPWEPMGLKLAGVCRDGSELLEMAVQEKPHIILTDIRMPVTDGIQLIEQLRIHEIFARIIIISGYNDFIYMKKAIEFDVVSYLMKPIQEDELQAALQKAILMVGEQETISRISRSVHEWEERESIRKATLQLQDWIRDPEQQGDVRGPDYEFDLPAEWLLYQLPINENYNLKVPDVSKLLEYRQALTEAGLKVHFLCQPSETLLALVIPLSSTANVEQTAAWMEQFLRQEDVPFTRTRSCSFQSPNAMRKEWIHAVVELYENLYDSSFAVGPRTSGLSAQDQQALRIHLSMGDFRGSYHWLVERLDYALAGAPTISQLDELIRTTVAIYAEYVPLFRELREQLNTAALPALAFSGKDSFLQMFRKPYEWGENAGGRAASIIAYIHSNFTQPLMLEEIAKRFHYNTIYLGQLIKRETGLPFNQYINKLRIERAVEMLRRNGSIKLADLSMQLGFSDSKYFSKVFKKLTGRSPSHYCG